MYLQGVYYIQPEGRGGTAPLEGEKYQIHWYRGYLVTVGRSNMYVNITWIIISMVFIAVHCDNYDSSIGFV